MLPARGIVAAECRHATTLAIGLLFFLYGARLSTRAALAGLRHWRLHGLVLTFTFLVFPVLGSATYCCSCWCRLSPDSCYRDGSADSWPDTRRCLATSTAVHHRGSDRDRFLRLEEIASQRIALGQRVAARGDSRGDGRAVDDVPPNAVDSVRVAGPTVRRAATRPGRNRIHRRTAVREPPSRSVPLVLLVMLGPSHVRGHVPTTGD